MFNLMPRQSPFCLIHLVFEASRFFFIPIRLVESVQRIEKPAVPKHGNAISSVQFFHIRAGHHGRRIMENREMDLQHDVAALLGACWASDGGVAASSPIRIRRDSKVY